MSWQYDVEDVLDQITIPGSVELSDNARKIVLRKTAEYVMSYIIDKWPVDTALSLASFEVRPSGDSYIVYNSTDYAVYVHDGLIDVLAPQGLQSATSHAQQVINDFIAATEGVDREPTVARDAFRRLFTLPAIPVGSVNAVRVLVKRLYDTGLVTEQANSLAQSGDIKEAVRVMLSNGNRAQADEVSRVVLS